MKQIVYAFVVAIAMVLFSCGTDITSADTIIRMAQDSVAVEESPVFGKLPTLAQQYRIAKSLCDKEVTKWVDKRLDAGELISENDFAKMGEEFNKISEEIDAFYSNRLKELAADLKGKEFPCKYDKSVFQSVKVILKNVTVDSDGYCYIDTEVTATFIGKIDPNYDAYYYEVWGSDDKPVRYATYSGKKMYTMH